jgi:transcriptional regulator
MKEQITIRVVDITGSQLGISAEDGQKVFDKIAPLLKQGNQVNISFDQLTTIISLFLNAAVGQLYGVFDENTLKSALHVSGLADDDMVMLKRVVDNAKRYYANAQNFDEAWTAEVENDE